MQTAEILGHAKQIPYEITDAIREGDGGILEGRGDDECWQLLMDLESQWFKEGHLDAKIEDGESFNDIATRFVSFIEQLLQTHDPSTDAILLVSHGATLRVGLSQVLTNVDFRTVSNLPMHNACLIKAETTATGLICIDWCGEIISES